MQINRKLIEKYNKPVPRYTSYPPANFFTDNYTAEDYITAIKESNNQEPKNISFYIHIPFCKKMCFYCGCNSCPMAKEDEVKAYLEALKQEIGLITPLISKERKVSQIHYGGGTPNAIAVEYLEEINQIFFDNFDFIPGAEIAIECHPAYLDEAYIEGLKRAKFNRFSLGIQDFNLDVLKAANRKPSKLPVEKLVSKLKEDTNAAINLDFIYGLPLQTTESFLETIQKAVDIKPERMVTFSYAHVPWVNKAQVMLEKKGLPTGEEKINITEAAFNFLESNGYKSIGMDHYVQESDELYRAQKSGNLHRNFQGYCTRQTTGQVYAFGVSSISQLQKSYAQNTKSIPEYILTLKAGSLPVSKGYKLNNNELIVRGFISELMCNKKIDLNDFAITNNITYNELVNIINYNTVDLGNFKNDEILELNDKLIQMNLNGLPFIRNVAASFDPILKNSGKTFSKSV